MSKQPKQPPKPVKEGISPISGTAPPVEFQFKPGESGNPRGRQSAGTTLKEWVNVFATSELTAEQVRRIARDAKAPWTKRAAAERVLRTLEHGDLAEMEALLDGKQSLQELNAAGVNTEVIKKIKVRRRTIPTGEGKPPEVEVEREVELHDRAGEDFDRICDRTEGTPKQSVTHDGDVGLRTRRMASPRRRRSSLS
ncbi:MAG: hypothetical protein JWN40_2210 [Phycisphaerales bacterium]|nr:hypothetical protein [Phycisphaerales bacterium]